MKDNITIGFQVSTAANLMKRYVGRHISRQDCDQITGHNGWIIGYLLHHHDGEPVYQRDLEEEFHIRRSTISKSVKQMEKNGLLERRPVPQDARLKQLVLTDRARRLHKQWHAVLEEMELLLRQGTTPEELEVFSRVVNRMIENLTENEEEDLC